MHGSFYKWACSCLALVFFTACGPTQTYDAGSAPGKQAIIDQANQALSNRECGGALSQILKLYESGNSDNDVRMITASAYACFAGVFFFKMVGDIGDNAGSLGGAGLWALMTKLFPSTTDDRVVESALYSMDALMAILRNDVVLTETNLFNKETYNPASAAASDRYGNSNAFLFFVSMAAIGGIQNRFGAPDSTTFAKTKDLKWETAATVDADGCAYASSIVNFIDALGGVASSVTGQLAKNLTTIQSAFETVIFAACDIGCKNTDVSALFTGWKQSGCTVVNAECAKCPASLRNRKSCTGKTDDLPSCAAAGIVNFINHNPAGWKN